MVIAVALLVSPFATAQDPVADVEHAVGDLTTYAMSWITYLESHADCDVDDLGTLQTDGVDAEGEDRPCDAPDDVDDLDEDRRVRVNGTTRGSLFFGNEGVDDTDVLALPTAASDAGYRFTFGLGLGLDSAEVEFGSVDFDILTQAGESVFDVNATFYQPEARQPDFPLPAPGNLYQRREAGDYLVDDSEYKVLAPPDHPSPPHQAFVELEDGNWLTLQATAEPSSARKYSAPASAGGGCGVVAIYMELPIGYAKTNSPHVAHAPARGACEFQEQEAPVRYVDGGTFVLPASIAGETLVLVMWVSEYTSDAVARQAGGATDTVMGLFAPHAATCDRDVCSFAFGGSDEDRKDTPTEYESDLFKDPPASAA